MRITGGMARGILLKTLDIEELRPATDMLRQSLFNSLAGYIPGTRFLDLFAGCGAYGLEALSAGAVAGTFVEKNPKLAALIRTNLAAVAKSAGVDASNYEARASDALRYPIQPESVDIVFCDPPYAMIAPNLELLRTQALTALKVGGLWLMEHPAELRLEHSEGFTLLKKLGGKGSRAPNVAVFKKL